VGKFRLCINAWIGAGCRVRVSKVHARHVLQEPCVLCRSFRPENALEGRLRRSALVILTVCDDGFVVTFYGGCNDSNGAKQQRARDENAIEYVGAAGWLLDELRQSGPLH